MADGDGETDVLDQSGNGKGVALNVFPDPSTSTTASNVTDADRGDITVAGGLWAVDPDVISTYGRTLTSTANAAAARSVLGIDLSTVPISVADRTTLANHTSTSSAYLRELGREGTFTLQTKAANPAWSVDTAQGIFVPSTVDTLLVWVRKFSGRANVLWWGATPGGADTSAAVIAAKTTLEAFALSGYGYSKGIPSLYFPSGYGRYYMNATTIELTHTMIIEGDSSGPWGGAATILEWASGATGIRSQRYNTSGSAIGGVVQAYPGGDGSLLRNLFLQGAYSGTEAEAHGVHLRAAISFENVSIYNFEGDGVYANCSLTSGGATEGSASDTSANGLYLQNNRRGIYLVGSDSNAGNFYGVHGVGNRQATIVDDSFLGNNWYGPSSHAAGLVAGSACTLVHRLGNLFTPIRNTAGHSTNSPPATGVDDARWYFVRAGTVDAPNNILEWTNGMSVREGGPFFSGLNNNVTIVSPYAEGNQSFSQFGSRTQVTNFNNTSGWRGGGNITTVTSAVNINYLTVSENGLSTLEVGGGNLVMYGGLTQFKSPNTISEMQFYSSGGGQLDGKIYSQSTAGGFFNIFCPSYAVGIRLQHGVTDILLAASDGIHVTGVGAFTGAVSASNLSGTNTGDQTITLSGDVSGSGTGAITTAIGAGKVTLAMQANMATASVVYRKTAGSGPPEVQTLATLKTDLGLTGTNSGDQTSIVGITGTLAQFNTAITDGNIVPEAGGTFTGDINVPAEVYGVGWNGSNEAPTKNDIYDKIETLKTGAYQAIAVGTVAPGSPAVNDLWVDTN